jgi:hypothetical protein
MSNSVEWLIEKCACADLRPELWEIIKQQAREMHKEEMRLDIEKKWEQYRIITNNEDAWSFKEWLIKQTYGDESNH